MYQPKQDHLEVVAEMIKKHLANNPDVKALSLFTLHENINRRIGRHEWEQALHRLNLQGAKLALRAAVDEVELTGNEDLVDDLHSASILLNSVYGRLHMSRVNE